MLPYLALISLAAAANNKTSIASSSESGSTGGRVPGDQGVTASVGYSHRTTVSVAVLTHALWFDAVAHGAVKVWNEDESW